MYHLMLVDDEENILKALGRVMRSNTDWDIEIAQALHDPLDPGNR